MTRRNPADVEAHSPGLDPGFSLVELLVATAIVGAILVGLATLLFRSQAAMERQDGRQDVRQNARLAVTELTENLRLAGYRIKNVPEALIAASTTSVSYAADIDDGATALPCTDESDPDKGVERITYRIAGGVLERQIQCWTGTAWTTTGGVDWQLLATGVLDTTTPFRYFDPDGVELVPGGAALTPAQRAEVTAIVVNIDIIDTTTSQLFSGTEHPELNLTSRIQLRNLGS